MNRRDFIRDALAGIGKGAAIGGVLAMPTSAQAETIQFQVFCFMCNSPNFPGTGLCTNQSCSMASHKPEAIERGHKPNTGTIRQLPIKRISGRG